MGDTWSQLMRAHESARPTTPSVDVPRHEPKAAILSCSDARVSPSAIFAQDPGSLFTVRVAGNTASPAAVASLEYAVEHLGVETIIVLGHTECGAVAAAMAGICSGDVESITGPICDVVRRSPGKDADEISRHSVLATIVALERDHGAIGTAIRNGTVEVVGAQYDVATGHICPIQSQPTTEFSGEEQ